MTYTTHGVSMKPMLSPKGDLVTLREKGEQRCRLYDVALYKRDSGRYVLHRIVEVTPEGYVFLGDNCYEKEYGVREDMVLAVLESYVHNGKTITVDDPAYQRYVRRKVRLYPLRCVRLRAEILLKKAGRGVRKLIRRS